MEHFEDEGQYVTNRLKQLNVAMNVDVKVFSMKARGGYSRSSSSGSHRAHVESSFLFERRLFQLELSDWSKLPLTESFKNAVHSLPGDYDRSSPKVRRDYEDFFNTWGHFVIGRAHGGGTVEVKSTTISSGDDKQSFHETKAALQGAFQKMSCGVEGEFGVERQSSETYSR